jgi:hypothetical protein
MTYPVDWDIYGETSEQRAVLKLLEWLENQLKHPYAPTGTVEYMAFSTRHHPKGAAAFLVSAASTIDAAANMTNPGAAEQIVASAQNAIAQFLDSDDICPPWPYPGPPPWLIDLASDLAIIANALQAGSLRTAVLKVAGQVLDRAQTIAGTTG